ncbi:methyltransferase domain-containing protein [Paractinoplanes rishiriensis]|uniref:Methyltransferase n=1 Tax=Paractinoplanes rishiriensis TaxID=1050105 RepID=A0A919K519_9ACTN|nr:methyltransferase domain-containing protein [Actinoplanes rishiriensis]GIE99704.1 methyltransferase [Actinoplanes rishiriensis]
MLDTEALIRALDTAESTPDATALRARSYDLLRLPKGGTVIDVGCGTGRAVFELGPHAIGVDPDPVMLAAAEKRFPGIDVRAADATDLPVRDGAAHGYRADKVFHVLPDPGAALAEARRVLAPGGRIVLLGQDWDTIVIDSDLGDLTRRIVHARADGMPHPRIARAYRNLLLTVGFREAEVEVHTAIFTEAGFLPLLAKHAEVAVERGAIGGVEAERWLGEQTRRAETGRLLVYLPIFVASATQREAR